MELFRILAVLSASLLTARAEETFTNSANLCTTCHCTQTEVFYLECQNREFKHTIANWPNHTTSLIASFSYNNMTHLEQLPDSDLAQKIILSHCGIETIATGAFEPVKNLLFLDLSYNRLTTEELPPETFKGPYNQSVYEPLALEDLNLAYNQIHSLPHNLFEHVAQLKQLNLEGNDFKVLDQSTQYALSSLAELEVLNLGNNELTELVGNAIRNLQKLRILDLSRNKIDFIPETLSLLNGSLEILYLDYNLIFEITDESFLGVQGIRILSLTNLPRLENINANSFKPLQSLSILYLSDNPLLTTIDRDSFAVNQSLEKLYIHNNSLVDLHYNLTNWSSLKLLNLKGNDLYCDCDLYKISQDLKPEIKVDKDGPICINPVNETSMMIYELTEETCTFKREKIFRLSHVIEHHFQTMKAIFVVVLLVAILMFFVAIVVAFLRWRKQRMNQNYPFVTRVSYNPIRGPNGI
ncbi:leucine-rich repeat-containing protein 70-like [Euwallacea fornicatus]|uniref:leucine-rich repeat-containing protein 70-like n=1 Tax=Euwallacea fornicatus TaxID=995702 RepID=UPI00338DC7D3